MPYVLPRLLARSWPALSTSTIKILSSSSEVYNPKAFILHAASLRQAFAHCAIFPTAASRRSLGRVSVPVWLVDLSIQLPVKSLGKPLPYQQADRSKAAPEAINLFPCGIMGNYAIFRWSMPHFRVCSLLLLTRSPPDKIGVDLHVLGTPPALILSQDQTLKK